MDPLTVLGLVANIVQVVDASARAATTCYQIYNYGATFENLHLAETAEHLQSCFEQLDQSLSTQSLPQTFTSSAELGALNVKCRQTAKILHDELKALQKSKNGGRREALSKFIKTKSKSKKINRLKETLEEYQRVLDTQILVDSRLLLESFITTQTEHNDTQKKALEKLSKELSACNISVSGQLRSLVDEVLRANTHEHEVTRQEIRSHVDRTVEQLGLSQAQKAQFEQAELQFMESLRYDEINLRRNEIVESYPGTFDWVFHDEETTPWDPFGNWLKHGNRVYWIHGKPGSGKSTLMKFIVQDQRTMSALNSWADRNSCLIISFFFWLSGSKVQRSFKGFLCSMLYQIFSNAQSLFHRLSKEYGHIILAKRHISDWSLTDLKKLFDTVVSLLIAECNICAFLDGVDEFEQEEDAADLLDYIQHLHGSQNIKFCVASRPEKYLESRLSHYPKLRLQDLTRTDMQHYIKQTLGSSFPKIESQPADMILLHHLILEKADGVFLWIHFALKSVLRGLRNEDDVKVLHSRLKSLPSGMEQLYEAMWKRLNGDEKHYREEAARYFGYHEHFPLSIFEMAVALSEDLHERYCQCMAPIEAPELIEECQWFQMRIRTRCAGLLDFTVEVKELADFEYPKYRHSFAFENKDTFFNSTHWEAAPYRGPRLEYFHSAKVSFIHRTARDFLLETRAGHSIYKERHGSGDVRAARVLHAEVAAFIQGLKTLSRMNITRTIDFIKLHPRMGSERELMDKVRKVCDNSNIPDMTGLYNATKWVSGYKTTFDWITALARDGHWQDVKYYVLNESHVSTYYKGFLFNLILRCSKYESDPDAILDHINILKWLLGCGADIRTFQPNPDTLSGGQPGIFRPIQRLLLWPRWFQPDMTECATEIFTELQWLIDQGVRIALQPHDKFIVRIQYNTNSRPSHSWLYIESSGQFLHHLAMESIATRRHQPSNSRPDATSSETSSLRVLAFGGLALVDFSSSFELLWTVTSPEGALQLGRALELCHFQKPRESHILNRKDTLPSSFLALMEDVKQRCGLARTEEWELTMGLAAERSPFVPFLDPSKDIDESNWWSEGWALEQDPFKGRQRHISEWRGNPRRGSYPTFPRFSAVDGDWYILQGLLEDD